MIQQGIIMEFEFEMSPRQMRYELTAMVIQELPFDASAEDIIERVNLLYNNIIACDGDVVTLELCR